MAQDESLESNEEERVAEEAARPVAARRGRRRRIALGVGVAGAMVLGGVWTAREDIADNLVQSELSALGLPATYDIVQIGPDEQIVRNVVIGDPAHPDLTIAEVRVATRLHFGLPGLGRITLVRPRLYGRVKNGSVSFGSLDKVLFADPQSTEPTQLPDFDLAVKDGGALLVTDAGRVGISLEGQGALRGGFEGELAAKAPALAYAGCSSGSASLYGKLSVAAGRPRLKGPLRLEDLTCEGQGASLAKAGLDLDLELDDTLDGGRASLDLSAQRLRMADAGAAALEGSAQVTYRGGSLNARYDLAAKDPGGAPLHLSRLELSGTARASAGFETLSLETDLAGENLRPGSGLASALQDLARSTQGSLVAGLADQIRVNLARQLRGSTLEARLIARSNARGRSVVVPQARVRARSGESLLELSRMQMLLADGAPRVSGNFMTSGRGLPRLNGRMETRDSGETAFHVQMADYRAGEDHVAIPEMVLRQRANGDLEMTGEVRLGGALPGGAVRNLRVPVSGRWKGNGDLALWSSCTTVTFDALSMANLTLDANRLSLCPPKGGSMARYDRGGFTFAAGAPGLELSGHLGESEVRLATGPVGLAYPGTLAASDIAVALGPEAAPSRFAIANLTADLSGDVAGTFENADVALAAVPLDLHEVAGNWSYAGGVLRLDDSQFVLVDRQKDARFEPMVARGASLELADNVISASARLREPQSDRAVGRVDIVHDLGTLHGHADLAVDGLTFGDNLQPEQLSTNLRGLVSLVEGTVTGTGRIDWKGDAITSRGRFASDGLDFAAPFGPVEGLSGEVVFTDLLGMVTAPDQRLAVASINPGIEVTNGAISFEMQPDYRLVVNGAKWPFMDGELTLAPTTMTVGALETRRYTLNVKGLNAASLVRHMELDNISASGVFDGQLPIVYDQNGARIENGSLVAREPGGNVAYVGALSYEDLSTMGNFAFDALKSIDYKTMEVTLNGSLSGEIITQLRFAGISQGTGAKRNFLTRQIAKLPVRFIVNIQAPFFQLFGNMRSLYDSNYVVDPRELGLVARDGTSKAEEGAVAPFISIQPPVSEDTP